MRTFTYVIVPALSLLNMGVEAATISKALTSKHSTVDLQTRKIVHDRQFHNADFNGLDSGHVARATPLENVMSNVLHATVSGENGEIVTAQGNPAFADQLTNTNERRANDLVSGEDEIVHLPDFNSFDLSNPQTITDSSSTTIDADKLFSEGTLSSGEIGSTAALIASTGIASLEGASGPVTPAVTPLLAGSPLSSAGDFVSVLNPVPAGVTPLFSGVSVVGTARRQVNETVDGDGAEEAAAEELDSMSTSLGGVSSLDSMVIPDSIERRMIKVLREDGSISASFGDQPVLNQNVPVPAADKLTKRAVALKIPVTMPRGVVGESHFLRRQSDATDLGLGAAGDTLDQSSSLGVN